MTPRTIEVLNYPGYQPLNRKPYDSAVGYLAMWAYESGAYPFVCIGTLDDGDLVASYYRDPQDRSRGRRPGFAMRAVRNPETGEYSFHS